MKIATYTACPADNDKNYGTFYTTSCCSNTMYSVKDKMAYDGCLCPRCYNKGLNVVLKFGGGCDWNDLKQLEKVG